MNNLIVNNNCNTEIVAKSEKAITRVVALLMLLIALGLNGNSLMAQDCPPIPDCWEPFEPVKNPAAAPDANPFEWTLVDPATGCSYTFTFCYRLACGGAYNDIAIGETITASSPECATNPFDPEQYNSIVKGCMALAVQHIAEEYYKTHIPNCNENPGESELFWRLGTISCTSEWYTATIPVVRPGEKDTVDIIVKKTTACNHDARCWNIFVYCWQPIKGPNGEPMLELMPKEVSKGDNPWNCINKVIVPDDAFPKGMKVGCIGGLCN